MLFNKIFGGVSHLPILFKMLSRDQQIGFSFNLADRCPMNCNCYWRAMPRVKELDDVKVIDFFYRMKREGKLLATIIGGEPYVRRNLLPKVTSIMPANWLITSGTVPLLNLPKTTHFISIDGKDAQTHDEIRGSRGLYDRVIKNLETARSTNSFPVFIHVVLNKRNHQQIEPILKTWKKNGLTDGVIFSLITHIRKSNNSGLVLNDTEMSWVVNELLRQKETYKDFLVMTRRMIKLYAPEYIKNRTPQDCPTSKYVSSFDAAGEKIQQCVFS